MTIEAGLREQIAGEIRALAERRIQGDDSEDFHNGVLWGLHLAEFAAAGLVRGRSGQ